MGRSPITTTRGGLRIPQEPVDRKRELIVCYLSSSFQVVNSFEKGLLEPQRSTLYFDFGVECSSQLCHKFLWRSHGRREKARDSICRRQCPIDNDQAQCF